MEATFFSSGADFRRWLEAHSAKSTELWVGYFKAASGNASMTWPESVDHALCYGWIDGIRKSIDGTRYMIRFTPRKPSSTWSAVNIKRVEILIKRGLMRSAGLAAFRARRATDRVFIHTNSDRRSYPTLMIRFSRRVHVRLSFFRRSRHRIVELPSGGS